MIAYRGFEIYDVGKTINRIYDSGQQDEVSINVEASYHSGIKPRSITNVGTLINHQSLLVLSVITVQRVAVGLLTRTCPLFTITVFSSIMQILYF